MSETSSLRRGMLKRALGGDRDSAEDLARLLIPIVQGRVARLLRRRSPERAIRGLREEVEDLTQDVLVSLFADNGRALRAWEPSRGMRFETFVAMLADRRAISVLRVGKRNAYPERPTEHAAFEGLLGEADASQLQSRPGPDDEAMNSQLLEVVWERLIERMSPLGRSLFEMLWLDELSVEEICDKTAMTREAVYAWRSRLSKTARSIADELMSELDDETRTIG